MKKQFAMYYQFVLFISLIFHDVEAATIFLMSKAATIQLKENVDNTCTKHDVSSVVTFESMVIYSN